MKPASGTTTGALLPAGPEVVVVQLPGAEYGSLDEEKLGRARRLLEELAGQPGPPHVVLDLSRVHFFGAGFVGALVSAWDQLKKQDRRVVLCGLQPYCARLIRTLQLDKLFPLYPTPGAALEEISPSPRGAAEEARNSPVRVEVSDVGWDPDLLRLNYVGDEGDPIRCVIVRRRG